MHIAAADAHIHEHPVFLLQKGRDFAVLALPHNPFAQTPQKILGARDEDESFAVVFGIGHRLSPILCGDRRYMDPLASFNQRMLFIISIKVKSNIERFNF